MIRWLLSVLVVGCAAAEPFAAGLLGRQPPATTFAFAPSVEIVRWGQLWALPGTNGTRGLATIGFLAGMGSSPVSPYWGVDGDLRLGSALGWNNGGWILAAQPRLWLDPLPRSQISVMPAMDFGMFYADQWFESEPAQDEPSEYWKATQEVYGLQCGASLAARVGWLFARTGSSWTLARWTERHVEPQSIKGATEQESASSKGWNLSLGLRFPIDHL